MLFSAKPSHKLECADFSGQNLVPVAASVTISGCSSSSARRCIPPGEVPSNCQRRGKTSSSQMCSQRMMRWISIYAKTTVREFGRWKCPRFRPLELFTKAVVSSRNAKLKTVLDKLRKLTP